MIDDLPTASKSCLSCRHARAVHNSGWNLARTTECHAKGCTCPKFVDKEGTA